MFVTTRQLETSVGVFQAGAEVSEEVAAMYPRYVQEVKGSKQAPKSPEPKEELLTEAPSAVEVEVEDEAPKKSKKKKKLFESDED